MKSFRDLIRKRKWIPAAGAAVLLAAGIALALVLPPGEGAKIPEKAEETTETQRVPGVAAVTEENVSAPQQTPRIHPDEIISPPEDTDSGESASPETAQKAGPADTPVAETPQQSAADTRTQSAAGISAGSPPEEEKYSCGTPGHNCGGPETHAFISNLELEGCPVCGSHSCPSFYAADEWGYTCYTPEKCPQYDIRKDETYYCQTCGRPSGSGSPDKCIRYVESCSCPVCGEWAEAGACHSCAG